MKTLVLSLLFFGFSHAVAQGAPQATPPADNWAAFSVGLVTFDAQIGFYDPFGLWANPRLVAGYVVWGGAFVNLDSLWFVQGRSGFYLGAGSGLLIDDTYTRAGLHLTTGTDIALNDSSGILIDSMFGSYSWILRDDSAREGRLLFPIFGRLSVGYRVSF